ncbi:MAG: hypothetical protein ACLQO7_10885 [Candidatus Bathyarchaeia archaeon]
MVTKIERGALSTSLSVLFALFLAQFFIGMALNLLVAFPTNHFPGNGGSFTGAIGYALTGGNLLLASHFIVDMGVIAVGAVNLALVIHKSNVYRILSLVSFIFVLSAFVNGARFVASNFTINGISYGMAGGFMGAFVLYFVMAMLMYRDVAIQTER